MSDWAALLGLTGLTSMREQEGGREGSFWRTCFAACMSVYETVTTGHTCERQTAVSDKCCLLSDHMSGL